MFHSIVYSRACYFSWHVLSHLVLIFHWANFTQRKRSVSPWSEHPATSSLSSIRLFRVPYRLGPKRPYLPTEIGHCRCFDTAHLAKDRSNFRQLRTFPAVASSDFRCPPEVRPMESVHDLTFPLALEHQETLPSMTDVTALSCYVTSA